MRQRAVFPAADTEYWKKQLLYWAATHDVFMVLDGNGRSEAHTRSQWEYAAAAGAASILELPAGKAFEALKNRHKEKQDWLFGAFAYELKNELETLQSAHEDAVGFPQLVFFQPQTLAWLQEGNLVLETLGETPSELLKQIGNAQPPAAPPVGSAPALRPRISREAYMEKVETIRRHIMEGDLYELNFCQEFFAENCPVFPPFVWERLNAIARAPMSTFFRWRDRYLLSASPERFLKKEGEKLISQPIKGTRRRSEGYDEMLRLELASSEKDRAENVMIVDLVRNDLARSCRPGSVQVDELFGIYSFPTVHQMISTVSGRLREGEHPIDALKRAFPPGSMTGAPKVMAMQLIEQYESVQRGLYSGAAGYFDPSGDFDFNVVIRSLFYNESTHYLSMQVGGAIVFDSTPEEEYEECLVKAAALFAALR